jgi:predicted metal-dependent peptidase
MTDSFMPFEEFNEISFMLERHHTLFYKLWTLGKPYFNPRIKTAQVGFNKDGHCITFEINPEFWQTKTLTQKLFIICHEAKHVINNHGIRGKNIKRKEDRFLANIAMDLCVNHDLVNRFGFVRDEVDPTDRFIWLDKIAKELDLPYLPDEQTFEFYYDLLKKQSPDMQNALIDAMGGSGFGTVDEHSGMGDITEDEIEDIMKGVMESDLSDDEKKQISEMDIGDIDPIKGRGFYSVGTVYKVDVAPVKSKKKWETVIKKWAATTIKIQEKERQQWVFKNRRFAMIKSDKFFIPSESMIEYSAAEKTKIKVWFFLDTSGSCIGYKNRFFTAAKSLPPERFDINLLCFDTAVYPTDLKSGKIYGGGGTKLSVMEKYIQKHTVAKGEKYPDAVFVITDADGGTLKPQHPERWYWFLTTYVCVHNVPGRSARFNLKNFE